MRPEIQWPLFVRDSTRFTSNPLNGDAMRMGILPAIGVLFVGLKLGGVIDWSWWWVMVPFMASFVFICICVIAAVVLESLRP